MTQSLKHGRQAPPDGPDGDRGLTVHWMLSPQFVASAEFTIVALSLLILVGFALPLLAICYHHFSTGSVGIGCSTGLIGTLGIVISGWKLSTALRRARRRRGEIVAGTGP